MMTTLLRSRLLFPIFTVLICTASTQSGAQPFDGEPNLQPSRVDLAIVGGLLIDGHGGPPLPGAVILVEGNRIVAVGSRDQLSVPEDAAVVDATGMTILPGLIDVHVHLDILGHSDYQYWHGQYRDRYADIMQVSARQLLMSGVTTVVDLAGQPEALRQLKRGIEGGDFPGPRVVASMGWITNWPEQRVAQHHRRSHTFNVHTVEEARAATRTAIQQGAEIIKVHSGLTEEQLLAIREEAEVQGIRITGHVGTGEDLLMRIHAGQDGIEHLSLGAGLSPTIAPDVIQGLVEQRTYVIPTLIQTMIQGRAVQWPDWRDNPRARALTPPSIWADIRRSIEHPRRFGYFGGSLRARRMDEMGAKIRQLHDAGVRLLIGTDAGTPLNFHTDATWQEMDLMVSYGIPAMEVLAMATQRNAEYLGRGNELGTITRGKLADLIVVDGNPLLSMRDLRHIVTVVKDGQVYTP